MKIKDLKYHIRDINDRYIQPMMKRDDFMRLNIYNYIRSEFSNEATRLQPAGTGRTDFINIHNMSQAWDYVLKNLNSKIDIYHIKQINHIISQNNNEMINGGSFRHTWASVLGQMAPNPEKIYDLLNHAVYKMNSNKDQILNKAFNIHYDIIYIQPFSDYNKRTARIIMNWFLLQNHYTPILFNHQHDHKEYVASLKARLDDDNKTYNTYMSDRMLKTQHAILKKLQNKQK